VSAREERQPVEPVALTEDQLDALSAAGNRALNDHYHDDLCHCREWPESCATRGYFMGMWDTGAFDIGLGAVLGLWESMRTDATAAELTVARDRIAELEAYAYGCDAEGCIAPHSSWCDVAQKAAAENNGCTCGQPLSHAMHCWTVNPPRNEVEELRRVLASYGSLELGAVDGRVSAACSNSEHPTWLRARDDIRGCPWCRVSELEAERHSTNEALSKAVERLAELEALTPAPIQTCRTCGAGYTLGQPCNTCQFQARMAAELAARQQPVEESYDSIPRFSAEEIARWQARQSEDPHDSPLHHDYTLGRELPTAHPTDAGSAL
jgi:hypothetical protein